MSFVSPRLRVGGQTEIQTRATQDWCEWNPQGSGHLWVMETQQHEPRARWRARVHCTYVEMARSLSEPCPSWDQATRCVAPDPPVAQATRAAAHHLFGPGQGDHSQALPGASLGSSLSAPSVPAVDFVPPPGGHLLQPLAPHVLVLLSSDFVVAPLPQLLDLRSAPPDVVCTSDPSTCRVHSDAEPLRRRSPNPECRP